MKYVISLDRYRSFERAAGACSISTSALSRSIQALEAEFGLRLFDRGRGGVFATPAGREFIFRARRVIHYADDLSTRMTSLAQAAAGEVTFGMTPAPAACHLAQVLSAMLCDHPLVRAHVKIEPAKELAKRVDNGEMEFFISASLAVPNRHNYQIEVIQNFDMFLMTRRDHPLANLDCVSKEDIGSYPLIGGGFDGNYTWPAPGGPIDLHLTCDNYETIFETVASSDACCIFPKLARSGNSGGADRFAYTRFSDDIFVQQSSFLLVRPCDRSLSLAAEKVIAQFRSEMLA